MAALVKHYFLALTLLSVFFSADLWAADLRSEDKFDDWWLTEKACKRPPSSPVTYPWQHVITANIGPGFNHNNGKTQSIAFYPNLQNLYQADSSSNALLYGELFLGMGKQLTDRLFSEFGLNLAGGTDANLKGNIVSNQAVKSQAYTYQYSVNEARVALAGRLLMDLRFQELMPYLGLDLGVGFNTAHGYETSPSSYPGVVRADFSKNTRTAFTYAVGVGLRKKINDYCMSSIGYEFADWGSATLSPAPGQMSSHGLSISHLYVNSLLFGITWLL